MDLVECLYHKITSSQSASLLARIFLSVFRGNVFKYSSVSFSTLLCLHFSSCANNGRTAHFLDGYD